MPKYYFHLRRGKRLEPDEIGLDFPSDEKAIAQARVAIAEMLLDASREGRSKFTESLEVVDENGRDVGTVMC